jgi:hypothetical protein
MDNNLFIKLLKICIKFNTYYNKNILLLIYDNASVYYHYYNIYNIIKYDLINTIKIIFIISKELINELDKYINIFINLINNSLFINKCDFQIYESLNFEKKDNLYLIYLNKILIIEINLYNEQLLSLLEKYDYIKCKSTFTSILIEYLYNKNNNELLFNYLKNKNNNIINLNNIKLNINQKIIVFSDIHADIHNLIILLRDCGKVISKKDFNNLILDDKTEEYLNLDLNNNEELYKEDLDYEWIGNDTLIVIIGDILDGARTNSDVYKDKLNNILEHEYPQIELKIFKLINSLNKQANKYNGKIIKILGNHEVWNFLGIDNNYIFKYTLNNKNYYKGLNRYDCFKIGNIGYNIIKEDGIYLLLKIDDYVFVHGGIIDNMNYNDYIYINNILNNTKDKYKLYEIYYTLFNIVSPIWTRDLNSDSLRIQNEELTNNFCNNLINLLKKSFNNNINKLHLIIGHCSQSPLTINNSKNITFNNIINSNNIIEEIGPDDITPKHIGYPDIPNKKIFGITMECDKTDKKDSYIYRIDVSSSRAFDNTEILKNINTNNLEIQYLYSRTPQVLQILNNNITIIRSKIKNTRIHQPRYFYELNINNNLNLNLTNKYYNLKYLKYLN